MGGCAKDGAVNACKAIPVAAAHTKKWAAEAADLGRMTEEGFFIVYPACYPTGPERSPGVSLMVGPNVSLIDEHPAPGAHLPSQSWLHFEGCFL